MFIIQICCWEENKDMKARYVGPGQKKRLMPIGAAALCTDSMNTTSDKGRVIYNQKQLQSVK